MQFFINIIFSFFLLLNYKSLYSQSNELKNEYRQTNKFFKEKNYSKALETNEKALKLSIKEFGKNHLTTATLYENKGRLLIELKNYSKAEEILREVVEIRNNLIKDYSPEHAEALNYLAISLRKQNKLEKAMLEHEKVLKIMGNIIANNPGQISELSRRSALYRARAYHTKGKLLIEQGNYSDAAGNFKIASKIYERTLGKNKKELEDLMIEINKLKVVK